MRNLLLIFSVLLSTSLSAVEYGNLQSGNSISLNQGDYIQILNFDIPDTESSYAENHQNHTTVCEFSNNDGFYTKYNYSALATNPLLVNAATFCGPGEVTASIDLHYKLTRASEYQNSNVFSVNGDSSSTHNIVVETSTDLENWTPVHSSGLTGSSEQMYVRTRISTSE